MPPRTIGALVRDCRGNALIEFALVLPVLLIIVTGILEFGFTFREYLVVTNAAREGARMAILPGYSDEDVKARVRDYMVRAGGLQPGAIAEAEIATGLPQSPADATYTVKTVTAQASHTFSMLAPIATLVNYAGGSSSFGTISLRSVSVMRVEVAAEGSR
jgi:Flp pilus assembly protein TadG